MLSLCVFVRDSVGRSLRIRGPPVAYATTRTRYAIHPFKTEIPFTPFSFSSRPPFFLPPSLSLLVYLFPVLFALFSRGYAHTFLNSLRANERARARARSYPRARGHDGVYFASVCRRKEPAECVCVCMRAMDNGTSRGGLPPPPRVMSTWN